MKLEENANDIWEMIKVFVWDKRSEDEMDAITDNERSSQKFKNMLIWFFDVKWIIHYEFVTPKQPVIFISSSGMFTAVHLSKEIKSLARQLDFAL